MGIETANIIYRFPPGKGQVSKISRSNKLSGVYANIRQLPRDCVRDMCEDTSIPRRKQALVKRVGLDGPSGKQTWNLSADGRRGIHSARIMHWRCCRCILVVGV